MSSVISRITLLLLTESSKATRRERPPCCHCSSISITKVSEAARRRPVPSLLPHRSLQHRPCCSFPIYVYIDTRSPPPLPPPHQPFGWEAREFVRRRTVGRRVHFSVNHKNATSGREYGAVVIDAGTVREENLAVALVQHGLAAIREGARGSDEAFAALQQAEVAAKEAKVGIWSDDAATHVRDITWEVDAKRALVDGTKAEPQHAIIEQVRDGCTVRAFLLPSYKYVTVNLSGVKTPMFKRGPDGKDEPEPFAEQAKYYVESRLLQREVKIVLEGVDKNNFLGTVLHPQGGNISLHLLREGLARVVDWSIGAVTQGREQYRTAQKEAQANKRRVWRDFQAKELNLPAGQREFNAVVEEIVSPESFIVRTEGGESRRIYLASLRQPKPPQSEGGGRPPRIWDQPVAFEAREFLRKKMVGKRVNVVVDYVKEANEGYPEKTCCTVKADGINVAEALISKGLATVLMHRGDDDNRSSVYDDLMAAQTRAQKNGKGVHAGQSEEPSRITEVTSKTLGDRFFPSLQRASRTLGVVEFIMNGSRMRVLVPRDSCVITVVLASIQCPRTGRDGAPDEPFAREALDLTRRLAMQHDVEVELESTDKNGNMVGHVHVGSTNLAGEGEGVPHVCAHGQHFCGWGQHFYVAA